MIKEDFYIIIMEYCECGSLADIIKEKSKENSLFTLGEVIHYFIGIYKGLSEIHRKKIIHRDIKPHNILIDINNTPKIGDFGLSIELGNETKVTENKIVGTDLYISPEILKAKEYSIKSDYWALGIVLYELCTLKKPFKKDDNIEEINIPELKNYPKEINDMIRNLLCKNVEARNCNLDYLNEKENDFKKGEELMLNNNYDQAIIEFQNSNCFYLDYTMQSDIWLNLGYCYFQKEEYEHAEEKYKLSKKYIDKNDKERKYKLSVNCGNIYYCRFNNELHTNKLVYINIFVIFRRII